MTAAAPSVRQGDRLVTATLVAERTALTPGSTGLIGVHLKIEPEWHVYWRNNGDSGTPVSVTFENVPGVSIGECQWPAPVRHVSDGDLLDYVHEREVTLVFPVKLDAAVATGGRVALKAQVDWLVCKEVCLPGSASVSLDVPVGADGALSLSAPLFDAARRRHARAPEAGQLVSAWSGTTLELRVKGANRLVFYPYESEPAMTPVDMLHRGDVRGESIRVEYPEAVAAPKRARGVLEVTRGKETEYLLVDAEGPNPR